MLRFEGKASMSPVAFWLFMAFELPLFAIQITILVVIVVQNYRRKYILSNDFCILYGLQNVAECVSYLDHFFSNRLLSSGLVSPTLIPSGVRGIVYTTTLYFRYYQYASHTAISLNRYTAMAFVTNNQRMWHGWLLAATLITVLACPVPSVILQLFNEALIVQTDDGTVVVMKHRVLHMINTTYIGLLCCGTCVANLFLDVRSFFIYRSFRPLLREQYVDDYRLLVFAVLQLIGQAVGTLYFVVIFLDYATSQGGLWAAFAVNANSYVYGFECLNGSVCLLATSKRLRAYIFVGFRRIPLMFRRRSSTVEFVLSATPVT